jgi:hypothetical protein
MAVRIDREVKKGDAEILSRKIRDIADRHGKVRLLVTVEHYPSLNVAESLYDDLRFVKWQADRIEKMAVVGDRPWKEHWVALFGLFGGIQCAYFHRTETDAAQKWLGN